MSQDLKYRKTDVTMGMQPKWPHNYSLGTANKPYRRLFVDAVQQEATYVVSPDAADQSVSDGKTYESLFDIVQEVGLTKQATIVFPRRTNEDQTLYVLAGNMNLGAYQNIHFRFAPGARLAPNVGITVTLPSPDHVDASSSQQIFSGSGAVRFNTSGVVYPDWWTQNATPGTTDMYDALVEAEAACASGVTIKMNGARYVVGTSFTPGDDTLLDLTVGGAQLAPAVATTLTLPSPAHVYASPSQHIFAGSGTVSFGASDAVNVRWFGAVGDGVTDDTDAFVAATAASPFVYVPQSSSFYVATALTAAQQKKLYGIGVVQVGAAQERISTAPFIDHNTANLRVNNQECQPAKWPTVDGSLFNGAVSIEINRTGGYGSYGMTLTDYLVSDAIPAGEFDVGTTSWVTAQNMSGGSVFGAWFGSNTPSSSIGGQSWASGSAIGMEINVGNRHSDVGLQADLGGANYTVGLQLIPDVLPAPDGPTVLVYPGTFALAVAPSVSGHKWWTGLLISEDAIVPGGRVMNVCGGSVVGNETGAIIRATGFYSRALLLSSATFSLEAIALGTSHLISWGGYTGTSMNGTATAFGLTTGLGTGSGSLMGNNYGDISFTWRSDGTNPLISFYGAAPVLKPTVAGAKGGNAALTSLMTALSNLGLVTDTTT